MNIPLYPQAYQLEMQQVLLSNHFHRDASGWKIVDNKNEKTFVRDNHYWLENISEQTRLTYEKLMPVDVADDWFLEAEIELMSDKAEGHYGLVWGFNEEKEMLNSFTVSADGKSALVMHHENNSGCVLHHFQKNWDIENNKHPVHLAILKMCDYYYFLINQNMFYVCEASHFAANGSYAGYCVDPGLLIRSRSFSLTKMIVKKDKEKLIEHLYF